MDLLVGGNRCGREAGDARVSERKASLLLGAFTLCVALIEAANHTLALQIINVSIGLALLVMGIVLVLAKPFRHMSEPRKFQTRENGAPHHVM